MRTGAILAAAVLIGAALPAMAQGTVYVPLGGAGEIVVIDAETDRIVDWVHGTEEAHGLAGTAGGEYLVAGSFTESVSGGSAVPPKPEGMSEAAHRAHHAKPAGKSAAETEAMSFLSLIRTAERKVVRRIEVPGAVHHTAMTPDGRFAIATHPNGGGVSVVDLSTFTLVKTLDTGGLANYVVVGADGRRAFVSNEGDGTVSEIDTGQWRLVRNIAAGEGPAHMVLSRDGDMLYVANADAGKVSAISLAHGVVVTTFEIGGELHGIDLSDEGGTLFVSARENDKVVAIDLARKRLRSVPLTPAPYHLAAVRGSGKIYVSSAEEPKIWVLDQASLKPLGEIPIGGKGHQMVVVQG